MKSPNSKNNNKYYNIEGHEKMYVKNVIINIINYL